MGETAAGTVTIGVGAAAAATAVVVVVDPKDDANLGASVRAGREQTERDAQLTSNPRADWGEQSRPDEKAQVGPEVSVGEDRAMGEGSDGKGEGEGDDLTVDMSTSDRAGTTGEAGAMDKAETTLTIVP